MFPPPPHSTFLTPMSSQPSALISFQDHEVCGYRNSSILRHSTYLTLMPFQSSASTSFPGHDYLGNPSTFSMGEECSWPLPCFPHEVLKDMDNFADGYYPPEGPEGQDVYGNTLGPESPSNDWTTPEVTLQGEGTSGDIAIPNMVHNTRCVSAESNFPSATTPSSSMTNSWRPSCCSPESTPSYPSHTSESFFSRSTPSSTWVDEPVRNPQVHDILTQSKYQSRHETKPLTGYERVLRWFSQACRSAAEGQATEMMENWAGNNVASSGQDYRGADMVESDENGGRMTGAWNRTPDATSAPDATLGGYSSQPGSCNSINAGNLTPSSGRSHFAHPFEHQRYQATDSSQEVNLAVNINAKVRPATP